MMTFKDFCEENFELDTPFKQVVAAISLTTGLEDFLFELHVGDQADLLLIEAVRKLKARLIETLACEFGYRVALLDLIETTE